MGSGKRIVKGREMGTIKLSRESKMGWINHLWKNKPVWILQLQLYYDLGQNICLPVDCKVKIMKWWLACVNGTLSKIVTGVASMATKGFRKRMFHCSVAPLWSIPRKIYQVTNVIMRVFLWLFFLRTLYVFCFFFFLYKPDRPFHGSYNFPFSFSIYFLNEWLTYYYSMGYILVKAGEKTWGLFLSCSMTKYGFFWLCLKVCSGQPRMDILNMDNTEA